MQLTRCRKLLAGAFVLLAGGCTTAETLAVTEPLTGPTASRAEYAFTTPYGEMWEVNGELVPAGETERNAVIMDQSSRITFSGECDPTCYVRFRAWMSGLWHNTRQKIHWSVRNSSNGSMVSGTADKQSFGWSCAWRVSLANCAIAERDDLHEVRIEACGWEGTIHTDHQAWWGAWFSIPLFEYKIGEVGKTEAGSIGQNLAVNLCGPTPPGGGDPPPGVCYDFYLVWHDEWGRYHEQYLFTWCFGSAT